MSEESKFKVGDQVRVIAGLHEGQAGKVTSTSQPSRTVDVLLAAGGGVTFYGGQLELAGRRITSTNQIRKGATYDLGGARFAVGEVGELFVNGGWALARSDIGQLLRAGAVITEVAPPPEPGWKPGDWVKDEQGYTYFYLPDSDGDTYPFKSEYVRRDELGGDKNWFRRDEIKNPDGSKSALHLHYRHGAKS